MDELKKYPECGLGAHYHASTLDGTISRCTSPSCEPETMGMDKYMFFEAHHVERLIINIIKRLVNLTALYDTPDMGDAVLKMIYDEAYNKGYSEGYEDGQED